MGPRPGLRCRRTSHELEVKSRATPFEIRVENGEARTRVIVGGEIDVVSAGHLRAVMIEALESPVPVLLDLAAVSFIDSVGICALLAIGEHAAGNDREWRLALPESRARRVFGHVGLDTVFPIVDRSRDHGGAA
jgi:anti-sigma B factor antagonist